MLQGPQARSDHVLQWHARRSRGDYGALCLCEPLGAVIIGAVAGWLVVVSASSSGKDAASTIRSGRSPYTASTASGACCRSGIFATGEYGAGWNGVVREGFVKAYGSDGVRGLLYGDSSQFLMQLINAVVVVVFGFVMAYVWFKISDLITPIRVSRETETRRARRPRDGCAGLSGLSAPSLSCRASHEIMPDSRKLIHAALALHLRECRGHAWLVSIG